MSHISSPADFVTRLFSRSFVASLRFCKITFADGSGSIILSFLVFVSMLFTMYEVGEERTFGSSYLFL